MPAYNRRIATRCRKGLPDLGQTVDNSHSSLRSRDTNTPFRLPRLYQQQQDAALSRAGSSVASYGHTEFLAPTPDLTIYTQTAEYLRMTGSPLKVPVKSAYDYPRLNHAMIAPKTAVTFCRSGRPYVKKYQFQQGEQTTMKSNHVRPQTALSDSGSIHWALGPKTSVNFDRMGQTRYQGPFSRVFTRSCVAPANWIRMKYGKTYAVH